MAINEIIDKFIISNPFSYTYFLSLCIRLVILFGAGFIVVFLFNLKDLKNILYSITFKKLFGWSIMAPIYLFSVLCGGVAALLFITYIVYKALNEFFKLFFLPRFYFKISLLLWFISVTIAILSTIPAVNYIFMTLFSIIPIIYLLIIGLITILNDRLEDCMIRFVFTFFACMWISYPMLHFIVLGKQTFGKETLLIIGCTVALSDVLAFCIGKIFDKFGLGVRYKIAKNISSNKTYAGIIGNIIGATIGVFIMPFKPDFNNLIYLIIFIILIGIGSSLGDMFESLVKRAAHKKDSGNSIPGHGGILDRIDSLLVVIIILYYFIHLIKGPGL